MELNRRETHRQLILRAARVVKRDEFLHLDLTQLKTRLTVLSDTYDRFMQEHSSVVENIADVAGMNEQNTLAVDVQEAYMGTASAFERRINEFQERENPTNDYAAQTQAMRNNRELQQQLLFRAQEAVNSAAFEEQTDQQLKTRRALLKVTYDEFSRDHRKLAEGAGNEEEVRENTNTAIQMQELYVMVLAKIEDRILELGREQRPIEQEERQAAHQLPRLADFRLESLKVNSFDGDYSKWNEWRALYDSLIHHQTRLSDTEKFHYLRRSLAGAAEQVLSGWHTLGENYGAAYQALEQVYDNSYRITMAHLDSIQKLPKATLETQEGLRGMIDTTNRVIRQLRVAGSPVEHWDHFMVYTLVSRMPPRTLTNWETTQDLDDMPTLEAVLKFLERRARGIINLSANQTSTQSKPKEWLTNESRPRNNNRAEATSSGLKCFKCSGAHPIYRCEEVLKKTVNEREKIIRNLKLCKNCFRKDHEAGSPQCRAEKCRVCRKEFHNSILCPNSKSNVVATVSTQENDDASSSEEQSIFQ